MSPVKKRRTYTVSEKLAHLRQIDVEGKPLNEVSRQLGIDRRVLQRWKAQKAQLVAEAQSPSGGKRKRVHGENKRSGAKYPDLENQLKDWLLEERANGRGVQLVDIKRKAISLWTEGGEEGSFTASHGWCSKFLNRNNFSSRKITGTAQKIPPNARLQCLAFTDAIKNFADIDDDNIYNMDETPVYFDMTGGRTYATVGSKDVQQNSTGYDKMRFTVVLTVSATGKKLRPMLIFKNLKKIPTLPKGKAWPTEMHISVAKGGSMTEELMKDYMRHVFNHRPGHIFGTKALLVLDAATSHKAEVVEDEGRNTQTLFIPPGCTPLLQPLDVSINKPFKCAMRNQWRAWIDKPEAEHTLTKGGKRQRASYLEVAVWVEAAWREMCPQMIRTSFRVTGITTTGPPDPSVLHTRLKEIAYPEEPIVMDIHSSDDESIGDLLSDEDDGLDEMYLYRAKPKRKEPETRSLSSSSVTVLPKRTKSTDVPSTPPADNSDVPSTSTATQDSVSGGEIRSCAEIMAMIDVPTTATQDNGGEIIDKINAIMSRPSPRRMSEASMTSGSDTEPSGPDTDAFVDDDTDSVSSLDLDLP